MITLDKAKLHNVFTACMQNSFAPLVKTVGVVNEVMIKANSFVANTVLFKKSQKLLLPLDANGRFYVTCTS